MEADGESSMKSRRKGSPAGIPVAPRSGVSVRSARPGAFPIAIHCCYIVFNNGSMWNCIGAMD